jgi:hypothetical protein
VIRLRRLVLLGTVAALLLLWEKHIRKSTIEAAMTLRSGLLTPIVLAMTFLATSAWVMSGAEVL